MLIKTDGPHIKDYVPIWVDYKMPVMRKLQWDLVNAQRGRVLFTPCSHFRKWVTRLSASTHRPRISWAH